jgi:hypothetical protein
MSEQEAKAITKAFVDLNMKAFEGDEMAQRGVVAYRQWFEQMTPIAALRHLLGGL